MICFQLAECRTLVQRALGFEPFLAQPMYRFGAWVALVICWLPCTAFRTVHDDLGQACPVEATPTHGDALCLTHCFLIYVSSIHDQCQEPRCRGRYVPGMSPGVKATEVWDFKRVCFLEVICAMPLSLETKRSTLPKLPRRLGLLRLSAKQHSQEQEQQHPSILKMLLSTLAPIPVRGG